jgi:hypothetical protein
MVDLKFSRRGLMIAAAIALPMLLGCGGAPGCITNVVTAMDATVDSKEAIDITDHFPADQDIFHAVVTISNMPTGSKIKTVWIAADVGSLSPQNPIITQTEIAVEGSGNLDFALIPEDDTLPPGEYRVDVYLNDELDTSLRFTVG